jgi:hypothetical protein
LNLDVIDIVESDVEDQPYSLGNQIKLPRDYFKDNNPCEDADISIPIFYGKFAHEATHVWQRQQGRPVSILAVIGYIKEYVTSGKYDPYSYTKSSDPNVMLNTFLQGDVDQQAQIVEDFVRLHQGPVHRNMGIFAYKGKIRRDSNGSPYPKLAP